MNEICIARIIEQGLLKFPKLMSAQPYPVFTYMT